MARARQGVVLAVVLLALLILEILAAGTLVLAHLEHGLARERMNALRAQIAARSGAAELAARWNEGRYQAMAPRTRINVFSNALDRDTRYATTLERLTPTLYLVRAEGSGGSVAGNEARAVAGLLIAVNDISAVAAQFTAAFTTVGGAQLAGNAVVSADQAALLPFGWSTADCVSWLGLPVALPALLVTDSTTVTVAATALALGHPAVLGNPALAFLPADRLGPLDFTAVQAIADRLESGRVSLLPVAAAGACLNSAPGNWGAPLDQAHPCADYFPLIFASTDLTIDAGAGQGVLVVDGDFTLGPGAHFYGIVLARGRIVGNLNSAIIGAAQSGSATPSFLAGGSIVRNNCAISRALVRGAALNRPIPRLPRSWIPLY